MQRISVVIIALAIMTILAAKSFEMVTYPSEVSWFIFVVGFANLLNVFSMSGKR